MFQRLWYSAVTLDRGRHYERRWELVTTLTEDAIAQIVKGHPFRAINGWLSQLPKAGSGRRLVLPAPARSV